MNLDKLAAVLRRRQGVESIDLGLLLGRRFWGAIIVPWLILAVPTLLVIQLVVAGLINPWVAIIVGWWFKPLFDRITLHVLSRGFFGTVPALKDTLRTVLGQWFSKEAMLDVTWRRFSPMRTMTMPVRVLEGSRGREASQRLKTLYGNSTLGRSWALLLLAICFKWSFYIGALVLMVTLTPLELFSDQLVFLEFLKDNSSSWILTTVLLGISTIATAVVEPFFGAGGFGIYIQRRIDREGWDLELRFRRLVDRVNNSLDGRTGILVAAGLAALFAAMMMASGPVYAQELQQIPAGGEYSPDDVPGVSEDGEIFTEDKISSAEATVRSRRELMPVDDAQAEFDALMEESPFARRTETQTVWERKEKKDDDKSDDPGFEISPDMASLIAQIFRVLMWGLLGLALLFVVWKIVVFVRDRDGGAVDDSRKSRWEDELLEEGKKLKLPDENIAQAARESWEVGRHREALAILLLSSLLMFEERHNFFFSDGWTTGRCAREVAHINPEGPVLAMTARQFARLAWAGRKPADQEFDELVQRWESVFERSGEMR